MSPKAASVAGGACRDVPLSHQVPLSEHWQATQNLVSGSEGCGEGTGFQVDPDGQVPAWHTPLPVVCLLPSPRSRVSGRCLGQASCSHCQLGLTLGNSCSWLPPHTHPPLARASIVAFQQWTMSPVVQRARRPGQPQSPTDTAFPAEAVEPSRPLGSYPSPYAPPEALGGVGVGRTEGTQHCWGGWWDPVKVVLSLSWRWKGPSLPPCSL